MRLRDWRKAKGWSQLRLAQELGVRQTFVSMLELRRNAPSKPLMERIVALTQGHVLPNDCFDIELPERALGGAEPLAAAGGGGSAGGAAVPAAAPPVAVPTEAEAA